jgi:hypothetical protein
MVKLMFFVKDSKNCIWITNKTKKNSEILIGIFLFFILCYFLHPDLIIDFSIVMSLLLF